jgi:thiamine-phosphate pyrophosphorylase
VSRPSRPTHPVLCYVTDRLTLSPGPGSVAALVDKIGQVQAAGIDWVQIREKDLAAREIANITRAALTMKQEPVGSAPRAQIFVNERLDVALTEGAAGVHLGENSLPVAEARKLADLERRTPGRFAIGVSCHSEEAVRSAADAGADYVFFGPVFATPSKARYGSPQGLKRLGEICQAVSIPVLAIGGITAENAKLCTDSGASGIAAIRLFQNEGNLREIVRSIRELAL